MSQLATFTPTTREDEFGGMIFLLKYGDGKTIECVSGLPGYIHCHPHHDHPGSGRPIPEGVYEVGEPVYDDPSVCDPAIGPWWIPLYPMTDIGGRDAFGMHCDWNFEVSPGTAGCPAPLRHKNMAVIAKAVQDGEIDYLKVDYGYGTV